MLQGIDENGKTKKLTGEFTDVHKVLVPASAVHQKGHFTWLESGGGFVISNSSKAGKELREAFERITQKYGTKEMLPLWEENDVYNFYQKKSKTTKGASSPSSSAEYVPMDVSANDQVEEASGSGRRGNPGAPRPGGKTSRPRSTAGCRWV